MPIKNEKREVVLFLASHKDITHTKMAEMAVCDTVYDSGSYKIYLPHTTPPHACAIPINYLLENQQSFDQNEKIVISLLKC